MKKKTYVIVDDSLEDIQYLQKQLIKIAYLELFKVCRTFEEAVQLLVNHQVDLLFLDIKLANRSGLDLLHTNIKLPPVIIVSSSPEFALMSYEIGKAADYVLKPFTYERISLALKRALSFQQEPSELIENDYIFLKIGRRLQRFEYQSIDYVEAYGIYSKVICNTQTCVVNERISTLEELLPSVQFKRVHKSYIINLSKIHSYDKNNFWIRDFKVPIGNSFRTKLESLLSLFDSN